MPRWAQWLGLALVALTVALVLPWSCCPGGCCRFPHRIVWEYIPGALPPVDNQGPTMTCVGWSVGYYAKTFIEKQRHPDWDVSLPEYQFSPSWVYNAINVSGTMPEQTLQRGTWLIRGHGCATRAKMHFTCDATKIPTQAAQDEAPTYQSLAPPAKVWDGPFETSGQVFEEKMARFKAHLLAGRPIVFMLNCTYDFFENEQGTPFWVPTCGWKAKHAIACVGFDDDYVVDAGSAPVSTCGCGGGRAGYPPDGPPATGRYVGAFRLRNSFGTCWRDGGSVWVPYEVIASVLETSWVLESPEKSVNLWDGLQWPPQQWGASEQDDPEPAQIDCGIVCGSVANAARAMTFYANEEMELPGPLYAAVPVHRCAVTTVILDEVGKRRIRALAAKPDPGHIGAFVDVVPFEVLSRPERPEHFRVVLAVVNPEGKEVARATYDVTLHPGGK